MYAMAREIVRFFFAGIWLMTSVAGANDFHNSGASGGSNSFWAPYPFPVSRTTTIEPANPIQIRLGVEWKEGQVFPKLHEPLLLEEVVARWGKAVSDFELVWSIDSSRTLNKVTELSILAEGAALSGHLVLQGDSLIFLQTSAGEFFVGAVQSDNRVILNSRLQPQLGEFNGSKVLQLAGKPETFEDMAIRNLVERALKLGGENVGIDGNNPDLEEVTNLALNYAQSELPMLKAFGEFVRPRVPTVVQALKTCEAAGMDKESVVALAAGLRSSTDFRAALFEFGSKVTSKVDYGKLAGGLQLLLAKTEYEPWLNIAIQTISHPFVRLMLTACSRFNPFGAPLPIPPTH